MGTRQRASPTAARGRFTGTSLNAPIVALRSRRGSQKEAPPKRCFYFAVIRRRYRRPAPKGQRLEIFDTHLTGLGLRITDKGAQDLVRHVPLRCAFLLPVLRGALAPLVPRATVAPGPVLNGRSVNRARRRGVKRRPRHCRLCSGGPPKNIDDYLLIDGLSVSRLPH